MTPPVSTDSPLHRTPWMNWGLLAANFLVFFLQWMNPQWIGRYELSPDRPRLMHYFTYAFLHQNIWHIASNLLFLYLFGNNVNDKMGHVGYLAFYLAGAVFAGVGYVVTQSGFPPLSGWIGGTESI